MFYTQPILNIVSQKLKLMLPPIVLLTLRSDYQGLTLPPLLTPAVDTTYSDVVLIACHETS